MAVIQKLPAQDFQFETCEEIQRDPRRDRE